MDEEIQEKTTIYTKKNSPFNVRKILAWAVLAVVIIIIIILVVAIVNTVKRNKAERLRNTVQIEEKVEETKKSKNILPTDKEAVKVDVIPNVETNMVTFIDEYREDTSAANTKYAGKEIETYGYIQNMTTSFADGRPFIAVVPVQTAVYTDERIQCFVKDETVFEGLKAGDGVIVKGIVKNFEFGFIPFENCSVRK